MDDILKIIENDDLESFKKIFDIKDWKKIITKIENYASRTRYHPDVSYDDVDCFKYAVHCNADKIFNYLLPQVEVNKNIENKSYGFPLLGVAIHNERYDYASQIVEHPSFNLYEIYHINNFEFIESKQDPEKHIEFLFNYLEQFQRWDFTISHIVSRFTHLICYNEETYKRFESIYRSKHNNQDLNLLNIFRVDNNIKTLGEEVFSRKYNKFIIEKLSTEDIAEIITHMLKDKIHFSRLFESENAIDGLNYLLKCPEKMMEYCNVDQVSISYLPLEGILLLEKNGLNIWGKGDDSPCVLDYILVKNNNQVDNKKSLYFMNKYYQEVYDKYKDWQNKKDIVGYCHRKIMYHKMQSNLPDNNKKGNITKI